LSAPVATSDNQPLFIVLKKYGLFNGLITFFCCTGQKFRIAQHWPTIDLLCLRLVINENKLCAIQALALQLLPSKRHNATSTSAGTINCKY